MKGFGYGAAALAAALIAAFVAGSRMDTAEAQPQQCPVVVENTTLKTDCSGPMVVENDGVNVNLGGHQVICNSLAVDGIVLPSRSRVHIENGHVHNCRNGIAVTLGGENRFNNLHLDGNGVGIILDRSDGNQLMNLHVADNSTRGVWVAASDNNRLHRVVAVRNHFEGIRVSTRSPIGGVQFAASSGNRLDQVVADDNTRDGLSLTDGASDNVVTAARARRNGRLGLFVFGNRNAITGSEFSLTTGAWPAIPAEAFFNGSGALVTGQATLDNELRANAANSNQRTGFFIDGGQRHVLQGNRARSNGQDGIGVGRGPELATTSFDTLIANSAYDNGNFDLADYPPGLCTLNNWISNHGVKLYNACETG